MESQQFKTLGSPILLSGQRPSNIFMAIGEGDIPEVHRWAYDYSKPGHEQDYVPQHIPLKKGEKELQH